MLDFYYLFFPLASASMTKDATTQKGRARVTSAAKRMVSFHLNSNNRFNRGPKRPKITDARDKLNQIQIKIKNDPKGVKNGEKVGGGEMVSKGEPTSQRQGKVNQDTGAKIFNFSNCSLNNFTFN